MTPAAGLDKNQPQPKLMIFKEISKETQQGHELRSPLLKKIKKERSDRVVITLFVSFYAGQPLMPHDADMIEEILCNEDCSKGVTLILDAPGGDGLTAERIVQACRAYSGNDFETIVPARAKSAATMVCLGSDRILMSPTSELGPIDPQVLFDMGKGEQWVAAHYITKTYDELFAHASNAATGRIEPYLQQLQNFNAVQVSSLKTASNLSEGIAVSSLKAGMMNGLDDNTIRENIKPFTDPEMMMSHGRGINSALAKDCGLNVEELDLDHELWKTIWSLYLRSKYVVDSSTVAKLIETVSDSFQG